MDDDAEIRTTMIEVLEEAGYVAIGASDGIEALAQLRDPEDRWCVVLLDLMMPNMDGREFRAQQLQDPALSPIPVVIVSAMSDVDEAADELQVSAHVTKPVALTDLVSVVNRFCPLAAAATLLPSPSE
ncbi:MAG TPA: response regulator [Kofleriaceae bacterium]|nr:response regulator [Kofleriaceae bacterium]